MSELPPHGRSEDQLEEKLRFSDKVREGLRQADAGETISHEEARAELSEWLD
jgi:predicted transcriptional regulator